MRLMLTTALAALLAGCSPAGEKSAAPAPATSLAAAPAPTPAAPAPSIAGIPAGKYVTDKAHTSLVFHVSHMGFSNYTGRFAKIAAELQLDPAKPAEAVLTASIDTPSLDLTAAPVELTNYMTGASFFDMKKFPAMTFKSTKVEVTGPASANVVGDFTMKGVTKPVTLAVTFNGGYPGMLQDPHARIGFSATGKLKRSEFDMSFGLPPPGSNMGVGDEVSFSIETEMSGPPFVAPAGDAAPKAPN